MAQLGERRLEDLDRLIQECEVVIGWVYPLLPFRRRKARKELAMAERKRSELRAWMRDPYYVSVDVVNLTRHYRPRPMPE